MANLGKWQIISLLSRFSALFFGLVQSVIIARILTVSEFGLINIVMAMGALAGIAQHLGLASGTTREISASKDRGDISKILISSVAIKYIATIPIALFLFVLAPYLSGEFYKHPEITFSVRLYALVLIIQGVQSIFNSVIAGLQKFKTLFVYQIAIACASLFIYIPFVWFLRVDGYFIALTLYNLLGSLALAFLALWPIRKELRAPIQGSMLPVFKNLLVLSLGIYFVKVLYTVWYKFGQVTLGKIAGAEAVGILSFALLYSSKLMTVSDALTDVNLPVFSKEFTANFDNFKKLFHENFDKVYMFIVFAGLSAYFFAGEIIHIAVGSKYDSSIYLILPLILSFAAYSFINLLKSSILIPAKMLFEMILSYICLLGVTTIIFFLSYQSIGGLVSVAYSMMVGGVFSFVLLVILIKYKLKFFIVDEKILIFSFAAFILIPLHAFTGDFLLKCLIYLTYSVGLLGLVNYLGLLSFAKIMKRLRI